MTKMYFTWKRLILPPSMIARCSQRGDIESANRWKNFRNKNQPFITC